MKKITVYGKGGIGKSTIVSNLSAAYALGGAKVLQVGCDPKADSTLCLREHAAGHTVLDLTRERRRIKSASEMLMSGRLGIACVESGGPTPGLGCGGRGVLRMLELFEEFDLIGHGAYDIVLYDVLGDLVCGGFAAPLRLGFGELVVIVLSEEGMAMYAANNIAKIVTEYSANGVALGGLIANLRGTGEDIAAVHRLADTIGTSVLGVVPRSSLFKKAERARMTVVEMFPDSSEALLLRQIADKIAALDTSVLPAPTPISNEAMMDFIMSNTSDD